MELIPNYIAVYIKYSHQIERVVNSVNHNHNLVSFDIVKIPCKGKLIYKEAFAAGYSTEIMKIYCRQSA